MAQELHGIVERGRVGAQHGLVGKRRKACTAPLLKCHAGKGVEIMAAKVLVERVSRVLGLDEHRSGQSAAAGAPAEEREKVKAKAQALLAQVRKAPETFAAVAKANSQEPA